MDGGQRDDGQNSGPCKASPYWWDSVEPASLPPAEIPLRVDVAIVGAGCTGLSAALALARAGRTVAVFDADEPGRGATTRSTGVIGRTLKHSFSSLVEELGTAAACRLYGEARGAFDFIIDLIERERIDCHLVRRGRFMGANSPRHYEAMARDLELKHRHLGDEYAMVPRSDQHLEIGSDLFHGGGVIPDHRLLHPGKYHRGLLGLVEAAGAHVLARTRIDGIRRENGSFELRTATGRLPSREVIIATNGYTGRGTPYLQRRVIPIDAYMVATEPLAPALLRELLPNGRCFHDYTINADYGTPSPHESRLLFGGLTGRSPGDLQAVAARLRGRLLRIFPQLAGSRLSHVWTGNCAATFDLFPHIGRHDGMHYAMGYCFGSGLPLGTWLGHKLALRVLGAADAQTAFDDLPFSARFFYWGRPWFLPIVMRYYEWVDRRGF